MARLLILTTHPTRDAGEVVDVFEDGHEFGALEVRQFAAVDLPGVSVEEAAAKWLEPGVPYDLRRAVQDAVDRERAAHERRADPSVIAECERDVRSARAAADPDKWPGRARLFDLSLLPRKCADDVAAHWAALRACAVDAKAAAKDAVITEIERREGRALTQAERDVEVAGAARPLVGIGRGASGPKNPFALRDGGGISPALVGRALSICRIQDRLAQIGGHARLQPLRGCVLDRDAGEIDRGELAHLQCSELVTVLEDVHDLARVAGRVGR